MECAVFQMLQHHPAFLIVPEPGTKSMDTATSMSTVDVEEAGTATPFIAQRWLERLELQHRSSSGAGIGGHDVWLCRCGHDFGDGSTLYAALAREHERSKEHQR